MFRGRYQLGEEVYLDTLCVDADSSAQLPAAAPWMAIYSGSTRILTKLLPRVDSAGAPSLFGIRLFLSAAFAVGSYRVLYGYQIGSYVGMAEDSFEVVAGGDADGAVVSMYQYSRPQVNYLINQRDGGRIFPGLNPRF